MFEFSIMDKKYKHIHFIGIGGISMSGLAEILLSNNYRVSGSDSKDSSVVERLKTLGAQIYIGHSIENIKGADLIIYTDAISMDNVELIAAKNSNANLIDRATFLGAIMKNYINSIAVSGTHGKTTTTSMIATITNHANLNPTVLLGGILDDIGGNVRLGSSKYIVTEACEYKANILKYFPTMAIILNIDEDHLDYFKNIDHIVDTFVGYVQNLDKESFLVINNDDAHTDIIIDHTDAKVITIGIDKDSDYKAENIKFTEEGFPTFTLNIKNKEYHNISLSIMGVHNIYNALAAIAATHTYGLPIKTIAEYLKKYKAVHRRLELKGYLNEVKIIDDYAHHPTEIRASLKAIENTAEGNIYCIFQPHTFTRTKILLDSFANAFDGVYKVIIPDIYAARERDNGDIHSRDLVNEINKKSSNAIYLSTFEEIEEYLLQKVQGKDIIVTMGAGNVYQVGESILKHVKKREAV
ncbi:UDP-N-acetylmuramate--L-alanine ligase [Paratissierella segnis]|jgi:UDP-N-acetylmuramate--alanine ligase|uniref:UDP-N-acetylmuramate--L-alanine ligase n=1 Tax=Paratissierella segnis TaxID=2763679 RepID=A0A926IJE0_9FIRM|nr:UDP-N-acetylmuramate--L-alanine ligase [Paratissierella segnis]MBC8587924.1 UDP-N-acetylmuramate--L-alanine ligase [Paratissierella segnis]